MRITGLTPQGGQAVQSFQINQSNLADAGMARDVRRREQLGQDQFRSDILASDYDQLSIPILQMIGSGAPSLIQAGAARLAQNDAATYGTNETIRQNRDAAAIVPAAQTSAQNFQAGQNQQNRWFQGQENEAQRRLTSELGNQPNPLVQQQALQSILQLIKPQTNQEGQTIGAPQLNPSQVPGLLEQTGDPNLGSYILREVIQNALLQQQQSSDLANEFFNQQGKQLARPSPVNTTAENWSPNYVPFFN